ncbi:MAG TPA: ABC transporter ATP-binding protein [Clostridiales bacterium]|nr:ABC transporter ATP-binding protein [Clostridiales bacterium]
MEAIRIQNLKKYYGKHLGIEDVTFSVNEGEIFGFVGPNGAGKSTTIRILLNFIFPDAGKASVLGKDAVKDSTAIKSFTGYVPSDVRFYGDMTAGEHLAVCSRFYKKSNDEETERLCQLFGLDRTKKFSELSMGNKKKLAVICALSIKPKVLILDEPTNGLDPMVQRQLFSELKSQAASGTTILLSSHNLGEVQEYCNRVAFIKKGTILSVTDLSEKLRQSKIITIWGGEDEHFPEQFQLLEQSDNKRIFRYEGDSKQLLTIMQSFDCNDFTIENESLQERFLELYEREEKL